MQTETLILICHLTLSHGSCFAAEHQMMSRALFPPELLLQKRSHTGMTLLIKEIGLFAQTTPTQAEQVLHNTQFDGIKQYINKKYVFMLCSEVLREKKMTTKANTGSPTVHIQLQVKISVDVINNIATRSNIGDNQPNWGN